MADTIELKLSDEAILTVHKTESKGISLVAGSCSLKVSAGSIELANGSSSLKVTSSGITIDGVTVDINAGNLTVLK